MLFEILQFVVTENSKTKIKITKVQQNRAITKQY